MVSAAEKARQNNWLRRNLDLVPSPPLFTWNRWTVGSFGPGGERLFFLKGLVAEGQAPWLIGGCPAANLANHVASIFEVRTPMAFNSSRQEVAAAQAEVQKRMEATGVENVQPRLWCP